MGVCCSTHGKKAITTVTRSFENPFYYNTDTEALDISSPTCSSELYMPWSIPKSDGL